MGIAIALHSALIRLEAENVKETAVVTMPDDSKPDTVPCSESVIPSTPAKAKQASFMASITTKDKVDPTYRTAVKPAKDWYIAYCFLHNSDVHRYASLLTMLSNQYMLGNDQYPNDLTQAHGMLVHFKIAKKSKKPDQVPTFEHDYSNGSEDDMTFLQHSKTRVRTNN